MRNQKTHSKTKYYLILLTVLFSVIACQKKTEQKEVYVAEVGDSKLSQSKIDTVLGNRGKISKYKDEFVRDWIETEILNQISTENDLLNKSNYDNILIESGKELSAAIAIDNYLKSHPIKYNDAELNKYFNQNKDDYNFLHDAFILNLVEFSDEENAIAFRNFAIANGWQKSFQKFRNDDSILDNFQNEVFKLSEIQSRRTIRVLQKLFPKEISLVVNTELNTFVVVQQIEKINKNTTPKFKFVKENVRKSYIVLKQREQIRNYLDSLIIQKKVKIY